MAVATANVRNVPDGICSCSVLKGSTSHSVGKPLQHLGAGRGSSTVCKLSFCEGVPCCRSKIIGSLVPESGIQFHEGSLGPVLFLYVFCGDGIQKAGSDDSYCRFKTESHGSRLVRGGICVEGILGNAELRIDQLIGLPVRELHGKAALHRAYIDPVKGNLILVDRRQEGSDGLRLWHAGNFSHIGSIVAVGTVSRVIDHEQVAVSESSLVLVLPFSVAVARMAVKTGRAHIGRAESLERLGVLGELAFERSFSHVEFEIKALSRNGRGFILITAFGHVVSGSEFSSGIPFGSLEIPHCLTYVLGIRLPLGSRIAGSVASCCKDCSSHE